MPKKLREYKINLEPLGSGQRAYPPDDNLGLRSKLGGAPDWDQNNDTPECPGCSEAMTFVGQIDSVEHKEGHNPHAKDYGKQDYMFGDVGMLYVFFCFECLEAQCVFQCG